MTPFSPRALDRGLAASLVALSRLGMDVITPPRGAIEILNTRNALSSVGTSRGERQNCHTKSGMSRIGGSGRLAG